MITITAGPVRRVLSRRVLHQSGQTIIQIVLGLVILGILLAIAVPSYRGYQNRANQTVVAQANVRNAVRAVEAYYDDNKTYVGMTPVALLLRDPTVSLTSAPTDLSASTYCIKSTVGDESAWKTNATAAVATSKPAGCIA